MQKANEPIKKVTLNLYTKDVDQLYRIFGWGWSEIVRKWVRENLNKSYGDKDEDHRRIDGLGP